MLTPGYLGVSSGLLLGFAQFDGLFRFVSKLFSLVSGGRIVDSSSPVPDSVSSSSSSTVGG